MGAALLYGKAESLLGVERERSDNPLLSTNHLESRIPLDLPGCSGSAFIAELPSLELRPKCIL